jgi:hypothetical protein
MLLNTTLTSRAVMSCAPHTEETLVPWGMSTYGWPAITAREWHACDVLYAMAWLTKGLLFGGAYLLLFNGLLEHFDDDFEVSHVIPLRL